MRSVMRKNLVKLLYAVRVRSPLVVAFSGGVDSSVVAKAAHICSSESVAVTVVDPSVSKRQFDLAVRVAKAIRIRHIIVGRKLADEVKKNDSMRCYHCKSGVIEILKKIAEEEGIRTIADGSNFDDTKEFRTGLKACREKGVYSPLLELGFGKKEVRELARAMKLPNYNAPSESCLSSRVMGREIGEPILKRISEAEECVREITKAKIVRVRDYGNAARIEVDREHIPSLTKRRNAERISKRLNKLGYRYVTVDLGGYRVGGV